MFALCRVVANARGNDRIVYLAKLGRITRRPRVDHKHSDRGSPLVVDAVSTRELQQHGATTKLLPDSERAGLDGCRQRMSWNATRRDQLLHGASGLCVAY